MRAVKGIQSKIKYVIEREMDFKLTIKAWLKNWLKLKFNRRSTPVKMYVQIDGNQFGYQPRLGLARPFTRREAEEFMKAVKVPGLKLKRVHKKSGQYYVE